MNLILHHHLTPDNNINKPPKIKFMNQLKFSLRKSVIGALSIIGLIIILITVTVSNSGCNGDNRTAVADTTAIMALKCADCPYVPPPPPGIQRFYHFRIDSAVLVDSFFNKAASPPFKKIIFNYKVNDYTDFPRSLSLVGHGAKNNDDLIDYNPEELVRLTNYEEINTNDLLYSTLELSRRKIENLVGANGTVKSYEYLVFIPYIETKNGQKHLSYKVQKRPIDPSGDEPEENLNPCPPFRPND